jgi:hypothetical protein
MRPGRGSRRSPHDTAAREWAADARRVAEELRDPSPDLLAAVETLARAAADPPETAEVIATQRSLLARSFERFEVVTGPADAGPVGVGVPEFSFTPHRREPVRVVLLPEPHAHLAELFPAAADPIDGFTEL